MGFHSVSESSNDNGSDRCFPMVKYGSCNRVGINVKLPEIGRITLALEII